MQYFQKFEHSFHNITLKLNICSNRSQPQYKYNKKAAINDVLVARNAPARSNMRVRRLFRTIIATCMADLTAVGSIMTILRKYINPHNFLWMWYANPYSRSSRDPQSGGVFLRTRLYSAFLQTTIFLYTISKLTKSNVIAVLPNLYFNLKYLLSWKYSLNKIVQKK